MQYINPIELLNLSSDVDAINIDNETIKKNKRKLFADIDLSDDGFYNYHQLQISKSDCEKVIDSLNNNDIKEYYLYLSNNKNLNEFLINGNINLFSNFKIDSIFKLSDFIKFISPFFAIKFDKALFEAVNNNKVEQLKSIFNTSILIDIADINVAYKSVSNYLEISINKIDTITKEIKNETSYYVAENIEELTSLIKKNFPTDTINSLPIYFQSQILKIAKSINYLQLAIWDVFENTQVPKDLLEHVLTFEINGLEKPIFENNYKIVKKKNDDRIIQKNNAPVLNKWATILLSIKKLDSDVESKIIKSNEAFELVENSFKIDEINNLPSFADEIRSQIAYSIRNLSIAIWNKQSDIKYALKAIELALKINTSNENHIKFKADLSDLITLEKKYSGILTCFFCNKNIPVQSCALDKTIYKETYRSYIPRRVQYSYSQISIPRCNSCKEIHSNGSQKFWVVFFVCLLLGIIIGAFFDENFIIGGIIGGILGIAIGKIIEYNEASKVGIKDQSDSTLRTHPLLIDKMNEGWTFSKPTA